MIVSPDWGSGDPEDEIDIRTPKDDDSTLHGFSLSAGLKTNPEFFRSTPGKPQRSFLPSIRSSSHRALPLSLQQRWRAFLFLTSFESIAAPTARGREDRKLSSPRKCPALASYPVARSQLRNEFWRGLTRLPSSRGEGNLMGGIQRNEGYGQPGFQHSFGGQGFDVEIKLRMRSDVPLVRTLLP